MIQFNKFGEAFKLKTLNVGDTYLTKKGEIVLVFKPQKNTWGLLDLGSATIIEEYRFIDENEDKAKTSMIEYLKSIIVEPIDLSCTVRYKR